MVNMGGTRRPHIAELTNRRAERASHTLEPELQVWPRLRQREPFPWGLSHS